MNSMTEHKRAKGIITEISNWFSENSGTANCEIIPGSVSTSTFNLTTTFTTTGINSNIN